MNGDTSAIISEGLTFFLASLLLAIPLAVVANLLTPKISDRLDRYRERSRKNSETQKEKLRKDHAERLIKQWQNVSYLHENRDEMYVQMTVVFLKVSVITTVGALLSSLAFTIDFYYFAGVAIGSVINALTALLALNIAFVALKVANRVRNFDEYSSEIRDKLQELGSELPTGLDRSNIKAE